MARDLTAKERAALEADLAAEFGATEGDPGPIEESPAPGLLSPSAALQTSRVDLIKRLRDGIPPRSYVPGCDPWLITGKRCMVPAPAGTGKSLVALIVAFEVVAAGGTAAVFDVENFGDEYARRSGDILEAKGGDRGELAEAAIERLRYYEYPRLSINWGPEEWAAELAGVDLAIFDSSRLLLSAAGLAEDSNDDYSTFVSALLVPLSRAGIATLVLDNTGHEEPGRARGAKAKDDLNEAVYLLKEGQPFDRDRAGHLRLIRKRTRFAELPEELHMPIGGGTYGPLAVAEATAEPTFRPTTLMGRLSESIALNPGIGMSELREAVKGRHDAKRRALDLLVAEGYVEVEVQGRQRLHTLLRPFVPGADPGPEPTPDPDLFGGHDD